ncbi:MAG: hypothetical protein DI536_04365 [Archangium gephyra]|uniref:Uncharacterized protein n=1 Tax=Archangium gephyra TaxID=48 RepID=A0A2W5VP61_9BACT|nr:MAG: hypothetical protein DI536_04365 [Archangium gephyra]
MSVPDEAATRLMIAAQFMSRTLTQVAEEGRCASIDVRNWDEDSLLVVAKASLLAADVLMFEAAGGAEGARQRTVAALGGEVKP